MPSIYSRRAGSRKRSNTARNATSTNWWWFNNTTTTTSWCKNAAAAVQAADVAPRNEYTGCCDETEKRVHKASMCSLQTTLSTSTTSTSTSTCSLPSFQGGRSLSDPISIPIPIAIIRQQPDNMDSDSHDDDGYTVAAMHDEHEHDEREREHEHALVETRQFFSESCVRQLPPIAIALHLQRMVSMKSTLALSAGECSVLSASRSCPTRASSSSSSSSNTGTTLCPEMLLLEEQQQHEFDLLNLSYLANKLLPGTIQRGIAAAATVTVTVGGHEHECTPLPRSNLFHSLEGTTPLEVKVLPRNQTLKNRPARFL
jgi:hypothetical protein